MKSTWMFNLQVGLSSEFGTMVRFFDVFCISQSQDSHVMISDEACYCKGHRLCLAASMTRVISTCFNWPVSSAFQDRKDYVLEYRACAPTWAHYDPEALKMINGRKMMKRPQIGALKNSKSRSFDW